MKNFDYKHIAYHTLVALYFIWLVVLLCLNVMAVMNLFNTGNKTVSGLFSEWIILNLIMGTLLFFVIRMFRNNSLPGKIIFYSYFAVVVICVASVITMRVKA